MEMNKETLEKMQQMRLQGMYYAFKTSLETLRMENMTIDQFISWLVSSEWDDRRNRAVERAVKSANFRYKANVEEIDFSIERGMDRKQILRLAELGFVKEHKDLVYYRKYRNRQELSGHRPGIPGMPERL